VNVWSTGTFISGSVSAGVWPAEEVLAYFCLQRSNQFK